MASMNYYEVLGVDNDASPDVVRKAFMQLVAKFHPDRYAGEERMRAETRFQTITEAFNILRNPASRQQYDSELSLQGESTSPVMSREEIARRYTIKGSQLYREGDLPAALVALQRAVDHDPEQPKALYYLGRILMKQGRKEREAVRYLEKASRLEPQSLIMKTELAIAYSEIGLLSRAERLAAEVLGLDPGNRKVLELMAKISKAKTTNGWKKG